MHEVQKRCPLSKWRIEGDCLELGDPLSESSRMSVVAPVFPPPVFCFHSSSGFGLVEFPFSLSHVLSLYLSFLSCLVSLCLELVSSVFLSFFLCILLICELVRVARRGMHSTDMVAALNKQANKQINLRKGFLLILPVSLEST